MSECEGVSKLLTGGHRRLIVQSKSMFCYVMTVVHNSLNMCKHYKTQLKREKIGNIFFLLPSAEQKTRRLLSFSFLLRTRKFWAQFEWTRSAAPEVCLRGAWGGGAPPGHLEAARLQAV